MKQFADNAEKIAYQAGEVLLHHWGKVQNVRTKSNYWDLVTEADTASEKVILDEITKRYPDHRILSEEAGEVSGGDSDYIWLVDPLDGTTNYSHTFPIFSVSIGLQYKEQIVVGVVFNPLHKELFKAVRGKGATLNGKAIHVSATSDLKSSLLATGFAYDRASNPDNNYEEFCRLTNISQGVRRLGSAALDLSYVAAGRLDGYWERGLQPWDLAAGALLVEEAGGSVTNYDEGPLDLATGRILASNGHLHHSLSEVLK